jgi:hypothetical protein
MQPDQKDGSLSTAAVREKIKQLEADLADQGLKLFPNTRAGQRAHLLWCRIREPLIRGVGVQITASTLRLRWHRQELKRARDVLVEMRLIRTRADGLYVLGTYDPVDELAREASLDLRLMEGVLGALGGLMGKSKTQKRS